MIEIKCTGTENININLLSDFQGNLKDLTKNKYNRLKKEIMERGFSYPFFVWKHDKKYNTVICYHMI